jgi:voltage-gated potassium channel
LLGFLNHDVGRTLAMTGTVLGLLGILTVEVSSWAIAYFPLGATRDFADTLYLSTAMFSTVGYGEIRAAELAAADRAGGRKRFLLIGWSTAYLLRGSTQHRPFRQGKHF